MVVPPEDNFTSYRIFPFITEKETWIEGSHLLLRNKDISGKEPAQEEANALVFAWAQNL